MFNGKIQDSDQISLKEFIIKSKTTFIYLSSRWYIIVGFSVMCLIGGFLYAQNKDAIYIADTSFSLDEEKTPSAGSIIGLAATFGFDVGSGGSLFTNENILHLFSSRRIIHAALLKPSLDGSQTHADQLIRLMGIDKDLNLTKALFPLKTSSDSLSRFQDSVLNILHKRIIADDYFSASKPDKKVDIYHVTVKSPDENFSSSFSKAIVDEVSKLYTEIKTSKAKQTVEILQRRVDSLRGSYTRALYGQAAILDANINPALRSVTVGAQQKQAEITTSSAAYQELLKNLEMSKYALLKQSPLFQIIDSPRFPLERQKTSRLLYGLIAGVLGGMLIVVTLLINRFLSSL